MFILITFHTYIGNWIINYLAAKKANAILLTYLYLFNHVVDKKSHSEKELDKNVSLNQEETYKNIRKSEKITINIRKVEEITMPWQVGYRKLQLIITDCFKLLSEKKGFFFLLKSDKKCYQSIIQQAEIINKEGIDPEIDSYLMLLAAQYLRESSKLESIEVRTSVQEMPMPVMKTITDTKVQEQQAQEIRKENLDNLFS